jgi:acetyltransferase-like isoleucine patch superfamily enzyme
MVRKFVKWIFRGLATLLVLPALVSYWIGSCLIGKDRALESTTQALALVPGLFGQYLRRAFLARTIGYCHPTATIAFGTIFSKAGARIEANVYIGPRCHLGLVHLGRDALLAAGVHVTSGQQSHGFADPSKPIRDQPGTLACVHIGAGAWIGSAAVVMADVGCDTVVGAGAVVTKPLPDAVIAAGVPARVMRSRRAEIHDTEQVQTSPERQRRDPLETSPERQRRDRPIASAPGFSPSNPQPVEAVCEVLQRSA